MTACQQVKKKNWNLNIFYKYKLDFVRNYFTNILLLGNAFKRIILTKMKHIYAIIEIIIKTFKQSMLRKFIFFKWISIYKLYNWWIFHLYNKFNESNSSVHQKNTERCPIFVTKIDLQTSLINWFSFFSIHSVRIYNT